ncbi:Mannosyl-oligosaccharide alpha-1 [Lasiodiplodia hormozganensis]|uniref:alpha-1,2-Mannosidase n=1 Tax=Lasiodiplodia hormozganensis TaxID=869390 RepID=A0AA39YW27_9PEZI|nr:Mannosyl-oligosaccharide alpha-1 [Lasiodiplodia hormozganensis]
MLPSMMLSPRKMLLGCTAFIAVFLIFIHSHSASYKLPVSSSTGGEGGKEKSTPVFLESDDGRFHWSQATVRYPVESLIPIPTDVTEIPRIQHDFPPEPEEARKVRQERLEQIKGEFIHAWTGYKEHAWLKDEVAPISGETRDTFGGWAATLVDSLDTLWIMDLKPDFEDAVAGVNAIDFSTCTLTELNVFETTIRYLGGFLAAYDVSGGQYPTLLQKAWELGHMLYAAFDTPNRMPVTRWNFKDAAAGVPQEAADMALSAELGSLTLEFTRLSQLTGDGRFFDAAQRIMNVFDEQQGRTRLPGMWPVAVNAKDLDFTAWNSFTIGGMADSLYEYLPKQHALLGGATPQYRMLFEDAARPMKEHMFYRPTVPAGGDQMLMPGDVSTDENGGVRLDPKNQHLSCFAGGMFGIAGRMFGSDEDVDVGRKLTEGCLWGYENSPNGVMPEILYTLPCDDESCAWDEEKWLRAVEQAHADGGEAVDARAVVQEKHLREGVTKIGDARYILRPEAIESVFILYRITGDETLRERAWKMFNDIVRLTKTDIAHAGLDDCVTDDPPKSDRMESFWTAETLKYFYLLFSDPNVVSLDDYVFNTEAHPLKRPASR